MKERKKERNCNTAVQKHTTVVSSLGNTPNTIVYSWTFSIVW